MKIYKTVVQIEQDGGLYHMDTIEYEGQFWLVPDWLESPAEGVSMPGRIICLTPLAHQKTPSGPFGDFVLSGPLPKVVVNGPAPFPEGYLVVLHPDIKISIPKGIH